MPKIGTKVLAARVRTETFDKFQRIARDYNTTVPRILDALCGVIPDHSGALMAFFEGEDDE